MRNNIFNGSLILLALRHANLAILLVDARHEH